MLLAARWLSVLKSRKKGCTTLIQALWAWFCIFHENERAGFYAQTREDAEDIFQNVRGGIERLPAWMTGKMRKHGNWLPMVSLC